MTPRRAAAARVKPPAGRRAFLTQLATLALAACTHATDGIVPYADYHVHLLGPYAAPAARYTQPITADRLIADLDEAGIKRALVLSEAA